MGIQDVCNAIIASLKCYTHRFFNLIINGSVIIKKNLVVDKTFAVDGPGNIVYIDNFLAVSNDISTGQYPSINTAITNALEPQSWVQLFDRNYTNEIFSNGTNLNLSNVGIIPEYTTGGYSLNTGTITNDTLVLPQSGYYKITISLNYSFLLPLSPPPSGSVTQILFNILNNGNNLGSLVKLQIIPDVDATIQDTMTTTFIHKFDDPDLELSVQLANFNYAYAFQNKLSIYDIIVIVEKIEKI